MLRNEVDRQAALEKARQKLASVQALLAAQNISIASDTPLPNQFAAQSDIHAIVQAVRQMARAIRDFEVVEELEADRHRFSEALRESLSVLASSLDIKVVAERILEYAIRVVPADGACITQYDNGIGRIIYNRGYSPEAQTSLKNYSYRVDSSQYARDIVNGIPYLISDTRTTPDWIAIPETQWIRSALGVPIIVRDQVIGLLSVDSATPDAYSSKDLQNLEVFATYAALAFKNAFDTSKLEEKVQQQTAALSKAKDRIEAIFNSSADGILLAYNHAGIQQTNATFHRLFGGTEVDYKGKPLTELVCDDYKEVVAIVVQNILETRGSTSIELQMSRLDGSAFDAEVSLRFIGMDDDAEVGLVCTIRDVSNQKIQERELQFYASVQASVNDAVIVTDLKRHILAWNHAAEKIYGWKAEEVMGKVVEEVLLGTFDLPAAKLGINEFEKEGVWSDEIASIRKDGSLVYSQANVTLLKDHNGKPFGIVGVTRDITERKERERQLRFHASLQENVTDAVVSTDMDFIIQSWNPAAERIYGWKAEEAIGQASGALFKTKFPLGETLESFRKELLTVGRWQREVIQSRKDGTEVQILASINIFKDKSGNSLGAVAVNHDITERKERERQLRFHASLQENVRDAVISTDLNFIIQSWNPAAERIYGWKADEVIGKAAGILHSEFTMGETVEQVRKDFLEKGYWTAEVIQHHKDGTPIYILSSVVLFKDDRGQSLGVVSVNHDITARRKADESLRLKVENELEFQIYLKALHEITIELTQIDRLDDFFRRTVILGLNHLGFDRLAFFLYDERNHLAIGTYGTDTKGNIHDEHHLRFPPAPDGIMLRALTRAERFYFIDNVTLQNDMLPVSKGWNATAVLWDGSKSLGWLVADNLVHQYPASKPLLDILALYAMTVGTLLARKQADAAMRESEARYRLLAENISDVIVRSDTQGEVLYVSPSCLTVFGYVPNEMMGQSAFKFILKEDQAQVAEQIALASKKTLINSVVFRIRHKQGHTVWVEATGRVIVSPVTGEVVELVASLRDMNERKKAEDATRQALEKERELNELKSRFVSMTSHEFRTPLANILASTETVMSYRHKMNDAQIDQRLDNVRRQVDHLREMIDDVLQLTRIDLQRAQYQPQMDDLDRLCREIVTEFENQPSTVHQIFYTIPDIPAEMWFDKKLIRQIITNLLSNAIKYSPTVKPVRLHVERKGDRCSIVVTDEGIGIPEADLKHLFEPFHRAVNVGTVSGTGLGLIIAQKAVELHGGTITVKSKIGIGTTVIVDIPLGIEKEA